MLTIDPNQIPSEVEVKGLLVNNEGRQSLSGPGKVDQVTLAEFRSKHRIQELVFDLARSPTKDFKSHAKCDLPVHVLFPQLLEVVSKYDERKVRALPPADKNDLFLSPYYGWLVERLVEAIQPDTLQGEAPEIPRYESNRPAGSTADVDLWTSRDVREVIHSHLNYAVSVTLKWEQSAAYYIDTHPGDDSFVKNSGLEFAIPYFDNGKMHDYVPDFLIRLKTEKPTTLIFEVEGFDVKEEIKRAAAARWIAAVNAEGSYGKWIFAVAKKPTEVKGLIDASIRG